MIQRKQNLYIFFSLLIMTLMLNIDYIRFSEGIFISNKLIKIIFIIILTLSLTAILSFRKIKIQIIFIRLANFIHLVVIMSIIVEMFYKFELVKLILAIIFAISLVFFIIALKAIKKDQSILKSYNNFR